METTGGRRTMQYRGSSLPLVTLSDVAQRAVRCADTRDLAVIVASVHGARGRSRSARCRWTSSRPRRPSTRRRTGSRASPARRSSRTGPTLIADVFELVDTVYPDWRTVARRPTSTLPASAAPRRPRRAVIVAGRPAGRGLGLLPQPGDAGARRRTGTRCSRAPDGEAAWELLQEHVVDVRLVVTDIEMPKLTGLGLATRIRADAPEGPPAHHRLDVPRGRRRHGQGQGRRHRRLPGQTRPRPARREPPGDWPCIAVQRRTQSVRHRY